MRNCILVIMLFITSNSFSQGEYNTALTIAAKNEQSDELYTILSYINKSATKEFSTNYLMVMVERDKQTKAAIEFHTTIDTNKKLYTFAQKRNTRNNEMLDCDWVKTMLFISENKSKIYWK